MSTQACARCNAEKPLAEFHHQRGHRTGLTSWCKPCRAARAAERWRDPTVKAQRLWYRQQLQSRRLLAPDGATKRCIACQKEKPTTEFYLHIGYRYGVSPLCKLCWAVYSGQRYKRYVRVLREEILARYGRVCACCGEATREFLTLDHIAGGGNKHRRLLGNRGGHNFYRWLRDQHYPDGYRVLCYNCNLARSHAGYCPHETADSIWAYA